MNPDDQLAATASGLDGTAVPVAWPDAAEAAREAASRRLRSLVIEDHALPEDLATATSSFALRSVDDELAALVYDSMMDDELFANVRSGAARSDSSHLRPQTSCSSWRCPARGTRRASCATPGRRC